MELATPDTCPMMDIEPVTEQHSYLWDTVVTTALLIFLVTCYGGGWLHGWWMGRNYILSRRHIRADRLQAQLTARNGKVTEQEIQIEHLERLLRKATPPGGPIASDREVKRLQQKLTALEHSFWYKDQQLRALDRKRMSLISRIGRLRGLVEDARQVVARARTETVNHAHNECIASAPIYIAPRGQVWHKHDQCPQLARSQPLERHACMHCATEYIPPYRYNDNTTTLFQDMNNFLGDVEDLSADERFTPEPPEMIPNDPEADARMDLEQEQAEEDDPAAYASYAEPAAPADAAAAASSAVPMTD